MPYEEPNEMDRLFELWNEAAAIVKKYEGRMDEFVAANNPDKGTETVIIEVKISPEARRLIDISGEILGTIDGTESNFRTALVLSGTLQVLTRIAEVMRTYQTIRPLMKVAPKGDN